MPKAPKNNFYVVKVGRKQGIFNTWEECEASVSGYPGRTHEGFATRAEAEHYLYDGASTSRSTTSAFPEEHVAPTPLSASMEANILSQSTNMDASAPTEVPLGLEEIVIFAAGGSKGNAAGVGVWWGPEHPNNLAERCPGKQTSNCAALIALVRVLEQCQNITNDLHIKSDNSYAVSCINDWFSGWQKRDFRKADNTPVANAPLICHLAKLRERATTLGRRVTLEFVKSSVNKSAMMLARQGMALPEQEERDWTLLTLAIQVGLDKIEKEKVEVLRAEAETVLAKAEASLRVEAAAAFCVKKAKVEALGRADSENEPRDVPAVALAATPWAAQDTAPFTTIIHAKRQDNLHAQRDFTNHWEGNDLDDARDDFSDTMVDQFNDLYGTDAHDPNTWATLCRTLGISDIPDTLHECRQLVQETHVNIVDLVEAQSNGRPVRIFESEEALSAYTKATNKFFPREHRRAGGVLRALSRHIWTPEMDNNSDEEDECYQDRKGERHQDEEGDDQEEEDDGQDEEDDSRNEEYDGEDEEDGYYRDDDSAMEDGRQDRVYRHYRNEDSTTRHAHRYEVDEDEESHYRYDEDNHRDYEDEEDGYHQNGNDWEEEDGYYSE